jgi:FkbM family methyltransferase
MRENVIKSIARKFYFYPGAVRHISWGPLRGFVYRVSTITGMAPWYSGAEREHQRTFQKLVWTGDVVMDVGANWGSHTLYFSRLAGGDGVVYAFEPFPPAFTELEWHMQANKCTNVRALPYAISDKDGTASFVIGDSPSEGSLLEASSIPSTQKENVSVITRKLDSLIEELDLKRVKLIKIDVEGAESRVLQGAGNVIERFRPHLVIDLHTPEQDVDVARFLIDRRYKLSRLVGPPILHTDVGWPDQNGVWGTILASPLN